MGKGQKWTTWQHRDLPATRVYGVQAHSPICPAESSSSCCVLMGSSIILIFVRKARQPSYHLGSSDVMSCKVVCMYVGIHIAARAESQGLHYLSASSQLLGSGWIPISWLPEVVLKGEGMFTSWDKASHNYWVSWQKREAEGKQQGIFNLMIK